MRGWTWHRWSFMTLLARGVALLWGVLVPDDNRCSDACRAVLVPEREAAITHAIIDHGPDGVTPGTTLACGLLTAQSEYGGDALSRPR